MQNRALRLSQNNKYRAQWEFANGITSVESTPASLQIARSNLCNFKCVYCSDHREGNEIPRTKLEGETWEALLRLIPRSECLAFHGISEFMIDRDFFDVVSRCADAGATLRINTNASVCTQKHMDVLAGYPGYLQINFSIDATSPETFLRIRGWDYWRVLSNIKRYVESFESRRERTWISLSFVITKSSVREMTALVYLAKALNVNFVQYYPLNEYESLDWQIEAKAGGIFSYRQEHTSTFTDEYNRELENTRRAAEILGLQIGLPAPWTSDQVLEPKNE